MFTQPCFIRKDTQELRDKLKEIGLQPHPCIAHKNISYLFVNRGFYSRNEIGYQEEIESAIDCGTNEELFLAIAALRDDSDKNQWFVLDTHLSFNPNANCIEYSKGNFIKCGRDKWNVDFNEDGTPCEFSSKNIPAHKATVNELIEHFKDK